MKNYWQAKLAILSVTHLLLLWPSDCSLEINGGKKISGKMQLARNAFCSIRSAPDQMVLMFQNVHNSTQEELTDCDEVRIGSRGEENDSKNIHILSSSPIVPDGHLLQLFFYDWQGNIHPTNLDGYDLTINNSTHHGSSSSCTISSYVVTLTAEGRSKFTRKTRTTIVCNLYNQVILETIPASISMADHIYEVVNEVAKLFCFYQWRNASSNYKVTGLDTTNINLTSHMMQGETIWGYQMIATLSFSTSPQRFRVLTVAVLVRSSFRQAVKVSHKDENQNEPQFEGFSIDVFKVAVEALQYHLTYKLVPFYGSCDQLVEAVASKTFAAAVGGIVITARRSHLVEYSQPYAELRLVMVIQTTGSKLNEYLWFMSPFTREMWLSMAAMTVFTGFVIWFVEHRARNNESADSTACRQVEAVFCFPFTFLSSEYRPRNKLSYFLLVPWLLLTLIVMTTFTASLGSIVTSSAEEQSNLSIDSLKKTDADVACDGNSQTMLYLEKVLGFKRKNIRNITSIDVYAKALSSGNIKAAFLLMPEAKFLLAKHCKEGLTKSGISFSIGNFGFMFPRGSALASDMSDAILEIKEAGELPQMQEDLLFSPDCLSSKNDQNASEGIGPGPFSGLFILSGSASLGALLITVVRLLKMRWESHFLRVLMGRGLIWLRNQATNELQLSRIS